MNAVLDALIRGFRDVVRPKMLLLLIFGPLLVSALVWGSLAFVWFDDWLAFVAGQTASLGISPPAWLVTSFAWFVAFLLLSPLVLGTTLLIVAVIAMPVMVREVAARRFPELERRRGGSALGSLVNFFVAFAGYLLLWLLTLPLWFLLAPLGVLVSAAVSGWFNQKLFRYDALAEHASREEYREIVARAQPRLLGLGFVLGLLQYIPLVNLAVPLVAGLAFIHLLLEDLAGLRAGRPSDHARKNIP